MVQVHERVPDHYEIIQELRMPQNEGDISEIVVRFNRVGIPRSRIEDLGKIVCKSLSGCKSIHATYQIAKSTWYDVSPPSPTPSPSRASQIFLTYNLNIVVSHEVSREKKSEIN